MLMRLAGSARAMLAAERAALNTLQHLSGIATLTRRYVDAIAGTGTVLLDTRKTVPGLRVLEKYAARMGGAENHRMRLDDGILLKDNHVAVCGGVAEAVRRAKAANTAWEPDGVQQASFLPAAHGVLVNPERAGDLSNLHELRHLCSFPLIRLRPLSENVN